MANVSSSNGLEKRPKLRFPGFDEPWKDVRLSDVTSFRRQRTKSTKNVYVSTENLLQNFEGIVAYLDKDEVEGIAFMPGDTLLANIRPYLKKAWLASFEGICSADVLAFSPEKIRASFLYDIIARDCFIEYVMGGVKGSKMPRGDKAHILEYEFAIPKKSEQEKISAFLASIDHRIKKQREMIDVLKKYKRGLLRDIFSKLNVRHDKRKLKDVAVLFADGDWIESKDQAPEGIRLVQTGNVGFGVYLDKPQNAKYISEATFHRLNCLEIYDGDILISRLPEPAGRACLLPQSTERRITAVDCTVIRTDKSVIDRTYLLQFLCSDQYLKTVNSLLAGGTRQRISRKNLEGIEVPYPSIDQQRYYGSFLCKVDARISNEENRLNCLSILRSSLLQQLFI